ncbi:MAG: HAD family hydrolase [Candidatus Paceibacteria bacterium]
MEKRKVAVFDIDGTVFRSSLTIALVERLIEKGIFPPEARATYEEEERMWIERRGDYETYLNGIIAMFKPYLKGAPYQAVVEIAGEIIEERRNHVYRYTRDLIKELKQEGYYLLAISGSPKFIVDGFAYEAGFDKSYGTFFTSGPSDNFTGEIEDEELIRNKSTVLLRAIRKENLTLEGSVGVGDTESDIPMLEMVERPIAFNPNQKLYAHAKRRGWEIVVERKDVIYHL